MSIFETILSSIIPSLFGGGGKQQGNNPMATPVNSMSPSQVPQQPPVTNDGGFLQNAGKLLGNEMLSSVGSRMTAGMRGRATLKYNENAFPGTNPWEHLGGGARGQELAGIAQSQNMARQQERASIRASQTQLGQSRMAATSALAGQIYQNNGNQSLPMISRILQNSGVITEAGKDTQDSQMSNTYLTAQIGKLRSGARLDTVTSELAPYLSQTGRISAGGAVSKEAKSIIDMWNSSKMKGNLRSFLQKLGGNNNASTAPKRKYNPLRLTID